MTELGEMLKEARIKKDYTLEDIQKITKIQKRYLESIEEGNLDALPGHFYARAFVKSYAEAVGLDPEIVLGQVKAELPPPPSEEQIAAPLRRGRSANPPVQAGRWLSRVLLYLFAVLILFVIYIAVTEYDKTPDAGQEQPAPTTPIAPPEVEQGATPPPEANQPVQPSPAVETPAPADPPAATAALSFIEQQNNIYKYELSGANEFSIAITAKGNCWLRVLKNGQNGEKVDELTLTPGMQKEWTLAGTNEAWIRLGSAPDVDITVNGQPLDTSKMKRSSQYIAITLKP